MRFGDAPAHTRAGHTRYSFGESRRVKASKFIGSRFAVFPSSLPLSDEHPANNKQSIAIIDLMSIVVHCNPYGAVRFERPFLLMIFLPQRPHALAMDGGIEG